MTKKLLAALITLLVVVASAKALKCYVCQYVDGKLPAGFEAESEDSCKTGKTPKDSFSKDCSTLEYEIFGDGSYAIPKSSGTAKKPRKDGKVISPLQANNNTAFSCLKMTMDGKFLFTNGNMKTTARTCILLLNTTQSLPEKCYANDISKITSDIKEQQLIDYIEGEVEGSFADNSKAGICSCSTDNCNGAINSVSASAFVLLTSTAVAYFTKFL